MTHNYSLLYLPRRFLAAVILILFSYSAHAIEGVGTKSMLISLAVPAIGAAYSFTLDDVEGLKQFTMSALVTAQLTTLMKNSVQRTRPNGANDLSFPSGHAASAFMGASYLQHRYGWAWGIPMYAIATAVSVERVNVKDHYWSDVIAGAALGYAVSAFFTATYPNAWVEPYADPNTKTVGVRFMKRFG